MRRDISGMRSPPDQIGRAHHHLDAGLTAGGGGLDRGGKLGEMGAMPGGNGDLFGRGVIMAGQDRTKALGFGNSGGLMCGAQTLGKRDLVRDVGFEFMI